MSEIHSLTLNRSRNIFKWGHLSKVGFPPHFLGFFLILGKCQLLPVISIHFGQFYSTFLNFPSPHAHFLSRSIVSSEQKVWKKNLCRGNRQHQKHGSDFNPSLLYPNHKKSLVLGFKEKLFRCLPHQIRFERISSLAMDINNKS